MVTAERVLRNYQTWPPKPPIDVENMRRRVDELFIKRSEERADGSGRGFIGSGASRGSFKPDGDGMASVSTSEGQTLVTLEVHIFRGHRLEIEERLRLSEDKKSLVYSQHIKGPQGKEARHEIEFEIAGGLPPVSES